MNRDLPPMDYDAEAKAYELPGAFGWRQWIAAGGQLPRGVLIPLSPEERPWAKTEPMQLQ